MVRRTLAGIVVLVLLGQTAAGIAAAALPGPASATATSCRCPHGEAAVVCPMHKAAETATRCTMRAKHDADVFALASLFGAAAVLPASLAMVAPGDRTSSVVSAAFSARSLCPIPDAPPPRA